MKIGDDVDVKMSRDELEAICELLGNMSGSDNERLGIKKENRVHLGNIYEELRIYFNIS